MSKLAGCTTGQTFSSTYSWLGFSVLGQISPEVLKQKTFEFLNEYFLDALDAQRLSVSSSLRADGPCKIQTLLPV